jgi:fatty acid desaturase
VAVRREEPRSLKERTALARSVAVVSNAKSTADLLLFVAMVVGAYGLLVFSKFDWLACVFAVFLVARAQNGLLLSGHEAAHRLLFSSRWLNDAVGAYVCFGPLGVGFERARVAHLDHHMYLLSERDEKLDQQIEHPTRSRFLRHLFAPLFGSYLLRAACRFSGYPIKRRAKPRYVLDADAPRRDLIAIGVSTATLFAVLAAIDWRLYVGFWLLPLLTVTAFFQNAKAFLDHARFFDESENLLYTYRMTLLDRLFFAGQQARHAEHHLYPFVPYHRLRDLEPVVQSDPSVKNRVGYFQTLLEYGRRVTEFARGTAP